MFIDFFFSFFPNLDSNTLKMDLPNVYKEKKNHISKREEKKKDPLMILFPNHHIYHFITRTIKLEKEEEKKI